MSSIGKVIGYILCVGSGVIMFIYWLMAMSSWLGWFGAILAFILTPGLVIFPFVFWMVEGVFPTFYFIVWGIGIIGLFITVVSSQDD